MLSFFPRGVLDGILNLIESVSEDFPSYSCRTNRTHAKAKKTGSGKLRSKFESLKRQIKPDVKEQHDLYVNNLV